jgi:hypothetical protein
MRQSVKGKKNIREERRKKRLNRIRVSRLKKKTEGKKGSRLLSGFRLETGSLEKVTRSLFVYFLDIFIL